MNFKGMLWAAVIASVVSSGCGEGVPTGESMDADTAETVDATETLEQGLNTPPSCIRWSWSSFLGLIKVGVKNNCSRAYNVKIVVNNGSDKQCTRLSGGESIGWSGAGTSAKVYTGCTL